jgi:hypothetical protein
VEYFFHERLVGCDSEMVSRIRARSVSDGFDSARRSRSRL